MAKGIVRKLDELGRITLPIEVRRRFDLKEGDRLGLQLDGQVIRISKHITGMSRPLDELGRITLPIEYRRTLSIGENGQVDTYVDGEEICLQKFGCEWCSNTNDLVEINGHKLCISCMAAVTAAAVKVLEG